MQTNHSVFSPQTWNLQSIAYKAHLNQKKINSELLLKLQFLTPMQFSFFYFKPDDITSGSL